MNKLSHDLAQRMSEPTINWRLAEGSHDSPSPNGWTSITETAILAAGFEYRKVVSVKDCPDCFSRPLATYAIRINSFLADAMCQQRYVVPFVLCLAGTADTSEIEIVRANFIAVQTVRRILALSCELRVNWHRSDLVEECRNVQNLEEARIIASKVRQVASGYIDGARYIADTADLANAAVDYAYTPTSEYFFDPTIISAYNAADAAVHAAYYSGPPANRAKVYVAACGILSDAIKLGRHDEINATLAIARLEKVRCEAMDREKNGTARTTLPEGHLTRFASSTSSGSLAIARTGNGASLIEY